MVNAPERCYNNGMDADNAPIPKRYAVARRWQWPAAIGCGLFALSCFIGWPLGYLWPSAVGLALFIPAIMVFNITCHTCGYPAFGDFQDDERVRRDDRFWTRFWGKQYGGAHLPLRSECSKCGARFVEE